VLKTEEERIPKRSLPFGRLTENKNHSPFTHEEPNLKQRENQLFSLFCNRNCSIVMFHPHKEILLRATFPTKQLYAGTSTYVGLFSWSIVSLPLNQQRICTFILDIVPNLISHNIILIVSLIYKSTKFSILIWRKLVFMNILQYTNCENTPRGGGE